MAKSKLTDSVQRKIVSAIESGNYANVAARAAGIGERTFYRWMEQGEKAQSGRYRQFWQAVKEAEAKAEQNAVGQVVQAGHDSWQAAMTYLERRFPERWRRRETQEITGSEGRAIEIVIGGSHAPDPDEDTP